MTYFMPRLTFVVYIACFRSIFTFFSAATFSAWSTLGFMGSDRIFKNFAFCRCSCHSRIPFHGRSIPLQSEGHCQRPRSTCLFLAMMFGKDTRSAGVSSTDRSPLRNFIVSSVVVHLVPRDLCVGSACSIDFCLIFFPFAAFPLFQRC